MQVPPEQQLPRTEAGEVLQNLPASHRIEGHCALLLNDLLDGFWICDFEGRFVMCNRAFCSMVGFDEQEWQGHRVEDVSGFKDGDGWLLQLKTGSGVLRTRLVQRDGHELQVELNVQTSSALPGYFCVFVRDITQLVQAEQALLESQNRYSIFINTMTDIAFLKDSQLRYLFVNQAMVTFLQRPIEEIIGRSDFEFMSPEAATACQQSDWAVLTSGEVRTTQETMSERIYEVRKFPVPLQDGSIGIGGYARDMTDTLTLMREWHQSAEIMRYIVKHDPSAIAVFDREMKYLAVSDRYLREYEVREVEVVGRRHYDVFPEIPQRWRTAYQRSLKGEIVQAEDDFFVRLDGRIIYMDWACRPWFDSAGEIGGIILYTQVITERKLAEQHLRESEERFRNIYQQSPIGVELYDADGRLIDLNPACLQIFGLDNADSVRGFCLFDDPNLSEETRRKVRSGQSVTQEMFFDFDLVQKLQLYRTIRSGGCYLVCYITPWNNLDGTLAGYLVHVMDITERKQAVSQLQESQRRLATLMSNLPGMAYRCKNNPDWTVEFVSEGCYALTGYSVQQFSAGFSYAQVIHPQDRKAVWEGVQAQLAEAGKYQLSYRIISTNGQEKWVWEQGQAVYDDQRHVIALEGFISDISARVKAEKDLLRIEWMLTSEAGARQTAFRNSEGQMYSDLTALNKQRGILHAVGKVMLERIANEYMDLLETSSAVYERNGEYALGIFSSGWCRMMDVASFRLCETEDLQTALGSGKWLCHEACWKQASMVSMEAGQAVDIACEGGIRLYALPVWANGEIVGAINFDYGDPPRDLVRLQELAGKYHLDPQFLLEQAMQYESRPPYIIELAKRRLRASALLIGEMVERKRAVV